MLILFLSQDNAQNFFMGMAIVVVGTARRAHEGMGLSFILDSS